MNNGGVLTCDAWNGSTGSVVFFRATGTVTVASGGQINVSGKGFGGGGGGSGGMEPGVQADWPEVRISVSQAEATAGHRERVGRAAAVIRLMVPVIMEATVGPRGMRDIMGAGQQAADPAEALLTQAAPITARPA